METRQICIRLPRGLYEELEHEAREQRCVISKIIKERLQDKSPSNREQLALIINRLTVVEQSINKGV